MKLVSIKDEYVDYLRKYSKNVKDNKNSSRPYVGIILEINNQTYYAPLGSPKSKHLKMKENLDFLKIEGGKRGVINLNNMIPASLENIFEINFSSYDKKYEGLLKDQTKWINRNERKIKEKSKKLYRLITEKENTIFHKRCNDFKLLEEKALEWEKNNFYQK